MCRPLVAPPFRYRKINLTKTPASWAKIPWRVQRYRVSTCPLRCHHLLSHAIAAMCTQIQASKITSDPHAHCHNACPLNRTTRQQHQRNPILPPDNLMLPTPIHSLSWANLFSNFVLTFTSSSCCPLTTETHIPTLPNFRQRHEAVEGNEWWENSSLARDILARCQQDWLKGGQTLGCTQTCIWKYPPRMSPPTKLIFLGLPSPKHWETWHQARQFMGFCPAFLTRRLILQSPVSLWMVGVKSQAMNFPQRHPPHSCLSVCFLSQVTHQSQKIQQLWGQTWSKQPYNQ